MSNHRLYVYCNYRVTITLVILRVHLNNNPNSQFMNDSSLENTVVLHNTLTCKAVKFLTNAVMSLVDYFDLNTKMKALWVYHDRSDYTD